MGFYGQRAWGRFGSTVVGDIAIDDGYVDNFWTGQAPLNDFSPPNNSVLSKARDQWQKLQDLIDLQAPSAQRAKARLNELRDVVGEHIRFLGDFHRNGWNFQTTPQVAEQYQMIATELRLFSDESWPDAEPEIEAHAAAVDATEKAVVKQAADADAAQKAAAAKAADAKAAREKTQAAIAAAQAAADSAEKAKQIAAAAGVAKQQSQQAAVAKRAALAQGLATPLTVAAIAVPLAFVAYFALRKKSSSVAGYRRRSSRRRR